MPKSLFAEIIKRRDKKTEDKTLDQVLLAMTQVLSVKKPRLTKQQLITLAPQFPNYLLDCDILFTNEKYLVHSINADNNGAFANIFKTKVELTPPASADSTWQAKDHMMAIKSDLILGQWFHDKQEFAKTATDSALTLALSLIDDQVNKVIALQTRLYFYDTNNPQDKLNFLNDIESFIQRLRDIRKHKNLFLNEAEQTRRVINSCESVSATGEIIMPWVNGISLSQFLNTNKLTYLKITTIALNIFKAAANLPNDMLHNDLWTGNIIIDPTTLATTIIDFGLASYSEHNKSEYISNRCTAPEQYSPTHSPSRTHSHLRTEKAEVFSLGLILAALLNATARKWVFEIVDDETNQPFSNEKNEIHDDIHESSLSDILTDDKNTEVILQEAFLMHLSKLKYILFELRKRYQEKSLHAQDCLSKLYLILQLENTHKKLIQLLPEPPVLNSSTDTITYLSSLGEFLCAENVTVPLRDLNIANTPVTFDVESPGKKLKLSSIELSHFMENIDLKQAEDLAALTNWALELDPTARPTKAQAIAKLEAIKEKLMGDTSSILNQVVATESPRPPLQKSISEYGNKKIDNGMHFKTFHRRHKTMVEQDIGMAVSSPVVCQ